MKIGIASSDFRPPSVVGPGNGWGGSGWVRLGQWLPLWAEHHEVYVGGLWCQGDHLQIEVEQPGGERRRVTPDLVYLHNVSADLAGLLGAARARGQVVLHDIDDWQWGLPAGHSASRGDPAKASRLAANLAQADVITTSTGYLAGRLAERFRSEIAVVANHVDTDRFTPVDQAVEQPTIGWAGAVDFRAGDLGELRGVLNQLDGHARFQHSGHADEAPSFAAEVGLPGEAVEVRGRVHPQQWPDLLDFQIGVVPLRDTPFNHAKSDLKGLEYAAAGIPFVASPRTSYTALREAWGECVPLARKPADWVKGLRRLLDPNARIAMAGELRQRARQRDLRVGLAGYLELFGAVA